MSATGSGAGRFGVVPTQAYLQQGAQGSAEAKKAASRTISTVQTKQQNLYTCLKLCTA